MIKNHSNIQIYALKSAASFLCGFIFFPVERPAVWNFLLVKRVNWPCGFVSISWLTEFACHIHQCCFCGLAASINSHIGYGRPVARDNEINSLWNQPRANWLKKRLSAHHTSHVCSDMRYDRWKKPSWQPFTCSATCVCGRYKLGHPRSSSRFTGLLLCNCRNLLHKLIELLNHLITFVHILIRGCYGNTWDALEA